MASLETFFFFVSTDAADARDAADAQDVFEDFFFNGKMGELVKRNGTFPCPPPTSPKKTLMVDVVNESAPIKKNS